MQKIKDKGEIRNRFLGLKVKVFINKANGQRTIILPKKILKNIPPKMNIKIPIKFFKILKGGNNK